MLGFSVTAQVLDALLREHEVDTVILVGLHTHICVRHTAADAFFPRIQARSSCRWCELVHEERPY